MMAWAINAFSNNSSSILQQKFQRSIDDQLSSPASPLQLLLAFSLGGFLRGHDRRDADLHRRVDPRRRADRASARADPRALPGRVLLLQLGVLVGVRAEQFDDVSFAQTFVLQPLIFLGGVFYSARCCPSRSRRSRTSTPSTT
jgi:ABC-2 type transport system permease protein